MAKLTPIKAIRAKCRDCTCNQPIEIDRCPITDCPLYEYRYGHRPGYRTKKNRELECTFSDLDNKDRDFITDNMLEAKTLV